MSHNYTDEEIREARTRLWYMGNLEWKFDPTQKRMYEFWKNINEKTSVINCSRRIGKSYFLTVIAVQQCIQKPKSIVKFLQPEQKMIRLNIRPIMDKILEDCPPDLKPEFKTQDNIYRFPNKSEIQLAGTDSGHHEKLRGGDAHLCLVDEAGFVKSELQYIVRSVLLPTTMLTRGKIILSSTSPKEPDHDFAKYMEHSELKNTLIRITIDDAVKDNEGIDNPRFTPEIVAEIENEYPGGRNSDDFRRECLCIIIQDGDNSIIPEFNNDTEKDIVVNWPRPTFYDRYVSMDVGFRDLTAVLFAYYDFMNAMLVIEDELILNGPKMTTEKLAKDIVLKERELWTDKLTNEFVPPYMRVSDNNLIVINDLQRLHKLTFLPTAKDNKEAAVNNVRIMVENRQISINPRCKTLINHLRHGVWNKKRSEFARSSDGAHYDACFIPGSKVLTKIGMKNIEDINKGDYVLTHNNRYKKVLNTMNKDYDGEILNIKVSGRDNIKCTPDHSFFIGESYKNRKDNFTGQKNILDPKWKPAKNLVKFKDYVYIPKIDSDKYDIINYKKIREIIPEYYSGKVYNLEVEGDNSYTVEGVSVHNCDALIYLVRNIDRNRNPYPKDYRFRNLNRGDDLFLNPNYSSTDSSHEMFLNLFKIRKNKN